MYFVVFSSSFFFWLWCLLSYIFFSSPLQPSLVSVLSSPLSIVSISHLLPPLPKPRDKSEELIYDAQVLILVSYFSGYVHFLDSLELFEVLKKLYRYTLFFFIDPVNYRRALQADDTVLARKNGWHIVPQSPQIGNSDSPPD